MCFFKFLTFHTVLSDTRIKFQDFILLSCYSSLNYVNLCERYPNIRGPRQDLRATKYHYAFPHNNMRCKPLFNWHFSSSNPGSRNIHGLICNWERSNCEGDLGRIRESQNQINGCSEHLFDFEGLLADRCTRLTSVHLQPQLWRFDVCLLFLSLE